jgi:hypothetical protein
MAMAKDGGLFTHTNERWYDGGGGGGGGGGARGG